MSRPTRGHSSSRSHFQGSSRTSNFIKWSQCGGQAISDLGLSHQRQHDHSYQHEQQTQLQQYYQQQKQPRLQQQQEYSQEHRSGYDRSHQVYSNRPPQSHYGFAAAQYFNKQSHSVRSHKTMEDINDIKLKVLQARARNLVIKRAIVKKNLGVQSYVKDSGHVENEAVAIPTRTLSASSSRDKNQFERKSDDVEGKKNVDKLSAAKEDHSYNKKEGDNNNNNFKKDNRREDKERPEVPRLPIDDSTVGADETDTVTATDDNKSSKKRKAKAKKRHRVKTKEEIEEETALTESLDKLMGDVNKEIETNQSILGKNKSKVSPRIEGGLHAPLDTHRVNESKRLEERKKRAEARKKIDSMLENDNLEFKIPRWRHELKGNMDPKPDLVLKGKSLFRMAAFLVLYFYAKPIVRVRITRVMGREMLREDLHKAILLALDTCGTWLCSAIRVPLTSILQDNTLHFTAIQQKDHIKSSHQQAILQLKVRLNAIVKGITKIDVESIPPHIKSFFEKLVTDGNFFRTDFLYPFEEKAIEFDKLGASNNVTKKLSDEEILKCTHQKLTAGMDGSEAMKALEDTLVVGDSTYQFTPAKILIRNFLLLRVLITNVVLSPWDHGVGPKPSLKQRKVVDNLRMVATILFEILKVHQPTTPNLEKSSKESVAKLIRSGSFKNYIGQKSNVHRHALQEKSKSVSIGEVDDAETDNESKNLNGSGTEEIKESLEPNDSKANKKSNRVTTWLTAFADKVLGDAQALNNTESDEATSFLLGVRPPYDNDMEHLQLFLFSQQSYEYVRPQMESWIKDLSNSLDSWVDRLTRLVVKDIKLRYIREHDVV